MKKIIFFLLIMDFVTASSQLPKYGFEKFLKNNKQTVFDNRNSFSPDTTRLSPTLLYAQNPREQQAKYLFSLANGTKVYALPIDNMPCIVPDIHQFNMPNAGKGIKASGMPPGAFTPYKIIPDSDTR